MSSPSHGPPRGLDFGWRLRNVVPNRRDSNPPFLGRLVDFSFRDPEAVVQPPVSGVVCLEPYRGDDRAVDGRSLLDDAVSFDGAEDLRAVGRGNRPVQVRTPDAIFAPPRMIRPVHRPADLRADDVALPGPEARRTRSRRTGAATSLRHTAFATCKVPRAASTSPRGIEGCYLVAAESRLLRDLRPIVQEPF